MRTAIDVVLAKPSPHAELMSMSAEVRQAVDHAERLIEALLVLARNDQARVLTDPLDLAVVAEDALGGRGANFTRLDDRIRHDGFGLGLTLVSSIAAVHRGTVDATAVPTAGGTSTSAFPDAIPPLTQPRPPPE
jgi:signal transduction histidine kinase